MLTAKSPGPNSSNIWRFVVSLGRVKCCDTREFLSSVFYIKYAADNIT